MVTRRDFLKTMSMASAGLALGTGDLLHAQAASPKKRRGDKVLLPTIRISRSVCWLWLPESMYM